MKYIQHTIFLLCFLTSNLFSQPSSVVRPRFVVGIMVDGLQQRHIDVLWNYLDSNGIRRLITEGTSLQSTSYNIVSSGNAADIATVMTGTTPHYNGISANNIYKRSTNNVESIMLDVNQLGVGTTENVSAHNLLSSTIVDELMMAYPNKSKSYAVAINAPEALMMGGHTATGVAWMDDVYLKWVSSSYYSDSLPKSASEMNMNESFSILANRVWQPLYSVNTYLNQASIVDKKIGFEYLPSSLKDKKTSVSLLKNTPSANTLVADLGYKIFVDEQLGTDIYPDMLMLQFTVRTPNEKTSVMQTIEKEDIYLRLDKDIEKLVRYIENKIGKENLCVFLYSNQTDIHTPVEFGKNKIPAGYFNAERSLSLVNVYLMAIYGQEKWIQGYYGKNIYLNRAKIEEKKLNLQQFQQTVAEFMLEFEGIQAAFPSSTVLSMGGSANTEMAKLRNSAHKSSMGDVVITLLPGWIEVDNKNNPVGESNAIKTTTPLYFYGWNIKGQAVTTPYLTIDIAPTISKILNIPLPNSCIGKVIEEVVEK